MPTVQDYAAALEQLIDLGRVILNQGLSLRRAIDNQSPDLYEKFLEAYVTIDGRFIHVGAGESPLFPPPPGAEETTSGRSDWVKGRLTVIRELANLDIDTLAWIRGSEEMIRKAGGLERFDPAQGARYKAIADEVRKLRTWTIPSAKFAKGYITPAATGSFLDRIAAITAGVGIDLNGLMKLLDGIQSIAGLALVVVGIYILWRLFKS